MNYSYTARSKAGEKMSGTIDAGNKTDALRMLERMGLIPVSLEIGATQPSSKTVSITLAPPKKIALPVGIILLVLAVLFAASPYWSLYRMRRAVQSNDAIYVSDHVDFPQLRESLKATFKTEMAKEVAKKDTDGFEALGVAFGAMMIGPMVDALVTPEGLIAMMQGEDIGAIEEQTTRENKQTQKPTEPKEMNVTKVGYEQLNRFVVEVATPPDKSPDKESLTLVFLRKGLFSWNLSGIRMKLK